MVIQINWSFRSNERSTKKKKKRKQRDGRILLQYRKDDGGKRDR